MRCEQLVSYELPWSSAKKLNTILMGEIRTHRSDALPYESKTASPRIANLRL